MSWFDLVSMPARPSPYILGQSTYLAYDINKYDRTPDSEPGLKLSRTSEREFHSECCQVVGIYFSTTDFR